MSDEEQLEYMMFLKETGSEDYDNETHLFYEKKNVIDSKTFWNKIQNNDKDLFQRRCKRLLYEFGTAKCCNRFDVGNCIELLLAEYIKTTGLRVINEPNAPDKVLFGLIFVNFGPLSNLPKI